MPNFFPLKKEDGTPSLKFLLVIAKCYLFLMCCIVTFSIFFHFIYWRLLQLMCFFFLFIFKIRPKYAKALTEVQPIREPIAYRPFAAPLAEIDPQFLLEEDYPSGSIQDLVKKEYKKLEVKLKPKTRGRGVAIMMRREDKVINKNG